MAGVAQLVRAPDCESGGRRFDPGRPPQITLGGFCNGTDAEAIAPFQPDKFQNFRFVRPVALSAANGLLVMRLRQRRP